MRCVYCQATFAPACITTRAVGNASLHKQRHLFRNQTKGIHTVSYSKTTRAWHASDCWWPMAVSGERDRPLKQATIMYLSSVPKFIICNEVHVQLSTCNSEGVLLCTRQSVSSNNKNGSWKEPVRLCNQLLSAGDPSPCLVSVYCQAGQWCSKALRFKSSYKKYYIDTFKPLKHLLQRFHHQLAASVKYTNKFLASPINKPASHMFCV